MKMRKGKVDMKVYNNLTDSGEIQQLKKEAVAEGTKMQG